ncbi:DUF7344 domain-containing protein [Haladaptatus salinisoli]|uniref:DUF7344 domain-containing protein n=1 Tax=Haladaptatus salinisoli TaxID=2884876 RepID=UPI001D0A7BB8|nr:hypothetical protein [Haladaptatus salinisoli]
MANRGDDSPLDASETPSDPSLSTLQDAVETFGLPTLLGVPPELHGLLASEQRQAVLARLHETDGRATVAELADHLVATDVERDERRARTALHHVHLPKLSGGGLVAWDRRDDVVTALL